MAEHELADGRPERHIAEDLGAHTGVNLDALELSGRERVGFREDVLGYGHVANVVQQRRRTHRLHLVVREAESFGERRRVILNRSDVLGRAPRLGFDRERERFDGRELHVHRAARFVLLFPKPRDDGVVTPEDQVERHRENRQPSEPAPG